MLLSEKARATLDVVYKVVGLIGAGTALILLLLAQLGRVTWPTLETLWIQILIFVLMVALFLLGELGPLKRLRADLRAVEEVANVAALEVWNAGYTRTFYATVEVRWTEQTRAGTGPPLRAYHPGWRLRNLPEMEIRQHAAATLLLAVIRDSSEPGYCEVVPTEANDNRSFDVATFKVPKDDPKHKLRLFCRVTLSEVPPYKPHLAPPARVRRDHFFVKLAKSSRGLYVVPAEYSRGEWREAEP